MDGQMQQALRPVCRGCAEGQEAGAQGLDWPGSAGRSLFEVLANAPLRMMRSQVTDIRDRFAYHLRCSVAENFASTPNMTNQDGRREGAV